MGKFTISWPFSIAMLNYRRVSTRSVEEKRTMKSHEMSDVLVCLKWTSYLKWWWMVVLFGEDLAKPHYYCRRYWQSGICIPFAGQHGWLMFVAHCVYSVATLPNQYVYMHNIWYIYMHHIYVYTYIYIYNVYIYMYIHIYIYILCIYIYILCIYIYK